MLRLTPLLLSLALLVPAASAQESTETLRLSGTPEIPEDLRDRLDRYLSARSAWLTDVSPDGQAVAFTTRFADTAQLHVATQPLGMRRQLTFRQERVGQGGWIPGTDDYVFSSDIGGNEQYQYFRLDGETGEVTMLTDGQHRFGSLQPSHGGDRFVLNSNARNGKDFDVWVGSFDDPANLTLIAEADGAWYPLAWSPDDSEMLLMNYISTTDRRLMVAKTDGSGVRAITNPKQPQAWRSVSWHPSGESIYAAVDAKGEFARLYQIPLGKKGLAKRGWVPLTDDIPWDVSDTALSPDGTTLAFTVNEEGWNSLWFLDVATGAKERVELPPGILSRVMWARDAQVLAFTMTSPTSTGDVWTMDADSRALTRWTESELGGMQADTLVAPTTERIESFDDLSIPLFIYTPQGEGPFPTIIDIHGGPEAQARPYFSPRVQALVAEGFAVVVPNVRGSAGYGRTYVSLDNGFLREDSVKDIGAVLDFLAEDPRFDAERVGVQGGSYGGYMVLASLTHYPERIKAGVDVVGISNFVTFLENTKAYRRDLRRVEYGDERDPKMRSFLERISPVANVDSIQSALFVAHGANDPRVPVGEAEQIVEAVRAKGLPVWSMIAMDEGHGFSKKTNRDTYTLLMILFFKENL